MLQTANNKRDGQLPILGGALAFFVGGTFVTVLLATDGWRGFSPSDAWRSLLFVAAIATILPTMSMLLIRTPSQRFVVAVATVLVAIAFFRSPVDNQLLWQSIAGGGALLIWLSLEPLTNRRLGASVPLGIAISAAASCLLMMYELRFASLAIPMMGLTAAMLVVTIALCIRPAIQLGSALLTAIIINSASLLIGWLYARDFTCVPWWCVLGIAVSPMGLWIARVPLLRTRPHLANALGLVATAALAGLSLAIA